MVRSPYLCSSASYFLRKLAVYTALYLDPSAFLNVILSEFFLFRCFKPAGLFLCANERLCTDTPFFSLLCLYFDPALLDAVSIHVARWISTSDNVCPGSEKRSAGPPRSNALDQWPLYPYHDSLTVARVDTTHLLRPRLAVLSRKSLARLLMRTHDLRVPANAFCGTVNDGMLGAELGNRWFIEAFLSSLADLHTDSERALNPQKECLNIARSNLLSTHAPFTRLSVPPAASPQRVGLAELTLPMAAPDIKAHRASSKYSWQVVESTMIQSPATTSAP
ncbi:hypothetical protein B0H13DRAFT_2680955 [Mycena leptocephala]|nr:hypothetical protein B0H13DRAFT_2680955 [Mycena leptocephala]